MAKPQALRRRTTNAKVPPRRLYHLSLEGELADFHVTLSAMSAREIIQIRSGEMTELLALEMLDRHAVEHDFDVETLGDLDFWIVTEILMAWRKAMDEAALPQAPSED